MPHRVSIRSQNNQSLVEIDGKPIVTKQVSIDLRPNQPANVYVYIEASTLELDLITAKALNVVVVPDEPNTEGD